MTEIISARPNVVMKSVSFRVKDSTAVELEQLKKRVKSANNTVDFKLNEVVDEQLVKLIKRANKQLDSLTPTSIKTDT